MFFKKKRNIENMSLLKSVSNDIEACVVSSLLESCGIDSQLDYANDGSNAKVVIGNSHLGVDIYVNKEDYDEACAILASEMVEEE